jgi:hypothetical protein
MDFDLLDTSDLTEEHRQWAVDVQKDPWKLSKSPEVIQGHKGVVMRAIQGDPTCVEFASAELRADDEVITEAITLDPEVLQFAAEELKADMTIARHAVASGWQALKHIAEEVRADKEFMLEQIEKNWFLAVYAADSLKKKQRFWLDVMQQKEDGWYAYVNYATPELLDDLELLNEAIRNDIFAFKFCPEALRADKDFVMQTIREVSWVCVKDIHASLRADEEVIFEACMQDLDALTYASEDLLENDRFIWHLVEQNPRALLYCPTDHLRVDREKAFKAVKTNGSTLAYIAKKHRGEKTFINEAINTCIGKSTRLGKISGIPWIIEDRVRDTPPETDDEVDEDDEENHQDTAAAAVMDE